uniref:hypothetical protein n=1 Tax=Salmonella enterica TaxID=28901 RepID=UPI0035242A58
RLRSVLAKDGHTMILLPEYLQDTLAKEAAGFQPILKRYGFLLLSNHPVVAAPQRDNAGTPHPSKTLSD